MTDTRADLYNIHAEWCSGGCSRWLAIGAPSCLPYPCRCPETRASAPDWAKVDPKCWWRTKAGAIRSRCPCWGGLRDGKPGDCCGWHLANPAYLTTLEETFLALLDDDGNVQANTVSPESEEASFRETGETLNEPDDGPDWGPDPARERKPYIRRWAAAELTCPCPTPWDSGRASGIHCPQDGCHQNFATGMAAGMHRSRWTEACRNPEEVVDVDTGVPLLIQDGSGVWRMDWRANAV